MLPFQMVAGGKFTLTTANIASGLDLECQSQSPPDFVILRSLSWGEANDAQAIEWFWERSLAQGTAKGILQSSAAANAPAMTTALLTSGGISTYDTANPPTFAALASSDINKTTFVATMANTGSIAVGDYVRVTVPVDMYQVSSYVFQVTAVTVNTSITLGYMASAVTAGLPAFASNADTANITKFIPNRMYPRYGFIGWISQATQAVVYFTATNDFTPGEIVSFRVSSDYGMEEINNVQARVLSVTNSATVSSITIDLDTTGFTAFSFPTSATALTGVSPAVVLPSSSGVVPDSSGSATNPQQPPGTNLRDSFDNRNTRVIHLGSGLFNVASFASDAGDVWSYQAFKYDSYNSV
jgi:hypothetical protein